jgi:plastocyanin
MRGRQCLVLLLVAGCGGGGGGTTTEPPPTVQRGIVQGTVRDEAEAGVAGAGVQLTRSGSGPLNATTNASGGYTFNAVDAGTWTLTASPPSGFEADGNLTTTVQVTANQTTTVPVLRMKRVAQPPGNEATVVSMGDNFFSPQTVTISRGRTVRWVNGGQQTHNSRSSTAIWSSPDLDPGQSFEHTFQNAGTFAYLCTLHAGMTGTVVVQ